MNVKITEIDTSSQRDNKHSIPNIVHILPNCNDHEKSWRDLNPEFVVILWDDDSLQRVIKQTDVIKNMNLEFVRDDLILASILCYHYGGVVVTKPDRCCMPLKQILCHIPNTLLGVFALGGESTLLDSSLVMSSPKISAFTTLHEYFLQAKKQSKSIQVVFRDFVKSSMDASNSGAIVCLHPKLKEQLTKEKHDCKTKEFELLQKNLPCSDLYKLINPSSLSREITPWLNSIGKKEVSANDSDKKIGILVIDNDTFDQEAPVPQAIAAVVAFQEINLCNDALVLVAHSPPGGIGLDMMILPQLSMLKGKEIYRTNHVAWKLNQ